MNQELKIYKDSLLKINPQLTEEECNYMQSIAQIQHYKSRELFITIGQIQRDIGFLVTGLVRGYYIDDKGEEITVRFVNENGYITHYTALLNNQPSSYSFQCLEECIILRLPFAAIQAGLARFEGIELFGRLLTENILKTQQKRIESFQFLSAEQRYLEFIRDYPELFNRVSLSHLSTYLGIQRPSLSRIRKKIARH
jgi:CRP/FNR family transcriptional regulator, anaerobic regulatory protein